MRTPYCFRLMRHYSSWFFCTGVKCSVLICHLTCDVLYALVCVLMEQLRPGRQRCCTDPKMFIFDHIWFASDLVFESSRFTPAIVVVPCPSPNWSIGQVNYLRAFSWRTHFIHIQFDCTKIWRFDIISVTLGTCKIESHTDFCERRLTDSFTVKNLFLAKRLFPKLLSQLGWERPSDVVWPKMVWWKRIVRCLLTQR